MCRGLISPIANVLFVCNIELRKPTVRETERLHLRHTFLLATFRRKISDFWNVADEVRKARRAGGRGYLRG